MNRGTQTSQQTLEILLDSLQSIKRHRWMVALVTVGVTLVSLMVIAKLPDEYRATTTILVDPQKIPDKYVSATVTGDPADRLNTITQEVLSTTRLQEIITQFNLYAEMRRSSSREEIIEFMRKKIEIQVKQGSGQELSSFTITYAGPKRSLVAQVANELARTFIDWNLKNREQQAVGTKEFLSTQLQQAKESLEDQESKLRDFKLQHLGETPDQLQVNLQTLTGLRVQLQRTIDEMNRLEAERTLLMRAPEQVVRADQGGATSERSRLESERSRLQSDLADLQRRYTADHPDVRALTARLNRVNAQLASLPASQPDDVASGQPTAVSVRLDIINRETRQVRAEQKKIEDQIARYQARVDAAPVREQQMTELTRNYEVSKQHYQSLLDKTFSAEMAAELERKQKGEQFTVIDPARTPEKPYKPARSVLAAGAFFAALCLGIGVALLLDLIRAAVRSERELKSILPPGIEVLAVIPVLKTRAAARRQRRFALMASSAIVLACTVAGAVLWRIHPIL